MATRYVFHKQRTDLEYIRVIGDPERFVNGQRTLAIACELLLHHCASN
jgi:hypothetical protein